MDTLIYRSDTHGYFEAPESVVAELFNVVAYRRYSNGKPSQISMGEIQQYVEESAGAEQSYYGDVATRAGLLIIVGANWGLDHFCRYFDVRQGNWFENA